MPPKRNEDGSANFSRIGRANKNRGRAFERAVADYLGWQRVPYSGAMIDWKFGDVIDGRLTADGGYWSAECKTQPGGVNGSLSIKHKWVQQLFAVESRSRLPIIITRANRTRTQDSWVLLLEDSFKPIAGPHKFQTVRRRYAKLLGKGHNFVIQGEWQDTNAGDLTMIEVGGETWWYMLRLDDFKTIINLHNLMVPL